MKITHRKKIKHSVAQREFYLYNIESFSEAPIEIIFIFFSFFHVFSKFLYVFWWLLYSSLAVDLSRSFLTYLIFTDTSSTGNHVSAFLSAVSLYSIPLIAFNGESPGHTRLSRELPCSGYIQHHFSFLTVQNSWHGWLGCWCCSDGMMVWWAQHHHVLLHATSGLQLP